VGERGEDATIPGNRNTSEPHCKRRVELRPRGEGASATHRKVYVEIVGDAPRRDASERHHDDEVRRMEKRIRAPSAR